MDSYLKNYINGQWVDSIGGKRHEVISPSTEEACTEITLGTAADVDAAVKAAREAFKTFSQTTKEERLALMGRIIEEYKKRAGDLALSMSKEMGAPISFAATAQVGAGIGGFMGTMAALQEFDFSESKAGYKVVYEPIGVVGLITPWNWPLNQIALKVAPCIAAGNTMVLKPSEECPGNAAIFAEILHAAGVPAGVFNLVQGDGPGVGTAISSHPDIEMVSFTGSTRAGILVAKAAADTVKRVHQELGGKSPNLVLPGADLPAVLPATVSGVWINSGQSCISPARILVHKDQEAEAIAVVKGIMEAMPVGDPLQEGGHIGPVVNKSQYEKIQGLIQSGIDEGAKLETGGTGLPSNVNRGYFVKPTVFSGVTTDMRIAKEEIFGPVASIITYDSLDQAIEIANDTEYGLSAAISGDPAAAAEVASKLRAGNVAINNWGPTPGAPFGGYKQSGNGREAGIFGLKDFMEIKAISGLPA
ncbi:MAG TPA: aldehyde dehydrogenase family protein [Chakrabartia sp.]|nr:aldehyde dehydrogenase family protein [Chakrabartia sp.]